MLSSQQQSPVQTLWSDGPELSIEKSQEFIIVWLENPSEQSPVNCPDYWCEYRRLKDHLYSRVKFINDDGE